MIEENGPLPVTSNVLRLPVRATDKLTRSVWPLNRLYYRFMPVLFKATMEFDVHHYNTSIDPLALHLVDPRSINYMTARSWPPWNQFFDKLGRVKPGEWDIPCDHSALPVNDTANSPPEIYHAERFEDTVFHQSMIDRFENGFDWEQTELYQRSRSIIKSGQSVAWKQSATLAELDETTTDVDALYSSIKEHGFKDPLQLARSKASPYLSLLRGQVVVDIARDGSFRFVDGRHRLSIAKILGLQSIPVIVLVRHEKLFHRSRRTTDANQPLTTVPETLSN